MSEDIVVRNSIYNQATGEIVGLTQYSGCTADFTSSMPGHSLIDGHWAPDAFYVVGGEPVPKGQMTPALSATSIVADGVDELIVSGLPSPCMVSIAGAVKLPPTQVTGGTLTLTSSQPGSIRLMVRVDPTHKPWEIVIDAT